MATIARHVIANEYPSVDESVKTVTSDSHEGTPHSDETRTRLEESGREDSPSSTSSGHEPCDSTVVCYSHDDVCIYTERWVHVHVHMYVHFVHVEALVCPLWLNHSSRLHKYTYTVH